jgi:uncharacterized protein (TIGR03435 family)
MRFILVLSCLSLAGWFAYGQTTDAPSFEVASIKPAASSPISCSGGPGTTDPGMWKCSSVPLSFLISNAYGLEMYQFTAPVWMRGATFDITAKVPAGTTKEQFQRMQQNLLVERFKLTLHHEQKEMVVYELTVAKSGLKMKESAPGAPAVPVDPWAGPQYSVGKDGYPVFPAGRGGLAGMSGRYRWTGVNLSMQEIVKALPLQLGRPVIDATGLKGRYDFDITWVIDMSYLQGLLAARGEEVSGLAEVGDGPTLQRAFQDQLGLKLEAKKGTGDIVVVDHVEKVPIGN